MAGFLEELILSRLAERTKVKHVVLMFSAVNELDYSALETLEAINHHLKELGVGLHLSEVKGPVMDRLKRSHLVDSLNGRVFLSQNDAWTTLIAEACE